MKTHYTGLNEIKKQPENSEKKHNATATSREALAAYTVSGKRLTEKMQALAAIEQHQPINSRRLCEIMEVERCHVTRCIKDLEQAGWIRVSHIAPCQITGKRVQHYCLKDWQPSLFNQ